MTYSVKWIPTNITFARRFDVYLDYPFFEHQVKLGFVAFLEKRIFILCFNGGITLFIAFYSCFLRLCHTDSLVLHFQFVYDGYFPHWFGVDDIDANS